MKKNNLSNPRPTLRKPVKYYEILLLYLTTLRILTSLANFTSL